MNDKKKNILFACYGLGIGGIEKCMVNLLNALPEETYDVDVLVMNPEYEMKPQIQRSVCFIDDFQYLLNTESTFKEIKKRGGVFQHLDKILPYLHYRVRIKLGLPTWTIFRPLPKCYDIAVAYSQNGLAPYYVIDKVQAKRKVLWYHNGDYSRRKKEYDMDKCYYSKFDYIVAVSNDCAKVLIEKFPFLKERIVVLRNFCDSDRIRQDSRAFVPSNFTEQYVHIVTVGRMAKEKGAELALEACHRLCEEGRNICWHWVGDGKQSRSIRKKIKKLGLCGRFILEGNQNNPYPYIYCGQIYVQPSYYEAYSTTVTEAKVLCRPIITTDVGGMRDQLTHWVNGLIVPIDASAIAEAVKALIDNKSMREGFENALRKEDFCSDEILSAYQQTVFR